MSPPDLGRKPRRLGGAVLAAALLAAFGLLLGHGTERRGATVDRNPIPKGVPVLRIVEGQRGYPYPYDPTVLHVWAGRVVAIRITGNLGGCGLVTMFPHLDITGGTATASVPVGATRAVLIRAPHPGTYVDHCGGGMYYGKIVAS